MEPLARILADAAGPKSWGDTPPTPFKLEMPFQYQQTRNGLDQVVCIEFLISVILFFSFLSSLCPPSAFIGSLKKRKCPIVTSSLPSDILCKWNQAIFLHKSVNKTTLQPLRQDMSSVPASSTSLLLKSGVWRQKWYSHQKLQEFK